MNDTGGHIPTPSPLPGPGTHVEAWAELAVDYVDGTLSEEARRAVDRHLSTCEPCRSALAHQATVARMLAGTDLALAPDGLNERLFAALDRLESEAAGVTSMVPAGQTVEERARAWSDHGRVAPTHPGWRAWLGEHLPRTRVWLPAAATLLFIVVALANLPILRRDGRETATTFAAMSAAPTIGGQKSAGESPQLSEGQPATTAPADRGVPTVSPTTASTTAPAFAPPGGTDVAANGPTPAGAYSPLGFGALPPAASVLTPYLLAVRAQSNTQSAALLVAAALGVSPVPFSLWVEGPTFAVFVSRMDLDALLERLTREGLAIDRLRHTTAEPGSPVAVLAHAWQTYPAVVAVDLGDGAGPVFVPESLSDAAWDASPGELALVVVTTGD